MTSIVNIRNSLINKIIKAFSVNALKNTFSNVDSEIKILF